MSTGRISRQITIKVENDQPGILAKVTGAIYEMGVNIEAICAYSWEGSAIFMLVTSDNESAKEALSSNGFSAEEEEVVLIEMADEPGNLSGAAKKLADNGVNLQFIYATATGTTSLIVLRADDNSQALTVLS